MSKHHGLVRVFTRAFIAALPLFALTALAEDREPLAVIELGGVGGWDLPNRGSGFGPTAG